MAFAAVANTNTTNGTAATNKACNLPANIAAGDLLILVLRSAGADTHTTPGGWSDLVKNNAADASDDVTSIFYKKADGTEGASVTVNGTTSLKFASLSWRITGAADPTTRAPEISTIVTGASTTPNPGALSPTGGAKDYLWLWLGTWDNEATSPPSGNPTNYTSDVIAADSGTAGQVATNCRCASASRQANTATEDPAAWTISVSSNWSAWTIAIHPSTLQTLTPSAVTMTTSVATPTVVKGARVLTPTTVTAVMSILVPTVTNVKVVAPPAITMAVSVAAPIVVRGARVLTPTATSSAMSVLTPTVVKGVRTLLPSAVVAAMSIADPTVTNGGGGPPPVRRLRLVQSAMRW